jgi:hypothetical protein
MTSRILSQARLKELLHYSPETGVFTWRVTRNQFVLAGGIAGAIDTHGYRQIKIESKLYLAHRLAFFYQTGEWPKGEVDHVNRLKNDNSFFNLRVVTRGLNEQNKLEQKNNKSGHRGVSWCNTHKRWIVQIGHNGKRSKVGYFVDFDRACKAYQEFASKVHSINPRASASQSL